MNQAKRLMVKKVVNLDILVYVKEHFNTLMVKVVHVQVMVKITH